MTVLPQCSLRPEGKEKRHRVYLFINREKNYIIIRTNIFGWNTKPFWKGSVEWIYSSLISKKIIYLFDDYIFTPIYTKELCKIINYLLKSNYRGTINIGSSNSCSKFDFGINLCKKFNLNTSLIIKSSIKDHDFIAKRPLDLSLPLKQLLKLNIKTLDYKSSIKSLYNDREKRFNKIKNQKNLVRSS